MEANLKNISASNDLSYYRNEKNIPNQELVNDTIEYFESGPGARAFTPLALLNLLEVQYYSVLKNFSDGNKVVSELMNLPINDLQKHILFGLILKWYGGYPIEHMLDRNQERTLKLIQEEFLSYPEQTPEKEFCKANTERRRHLQKVEMALNAVINHRADATEVMAAMDTKVQKEKEYLSFELLFMDLASEAALVETENRQKYVLEQTRHNYTFNVWLQENRGWEYGNREQYKTMLTRANFLEYLKHDQAEQQRRRFILTSGQDAYRIYQENYNALQNDFRIKRLANKEDCDEIPGLKEGDIIEFDPSFKTTIEAFTLLTQYYAKAYFEHERFNFIKVYKVWNEETIKAEIVEIEKFISEASKVTVTAACRSFGRVLLPDDRHVYRRFTSEFYENLEVSSYPSITSIGNREAIIYGRYFIFYQYLKERLAEYQPIKQKKPKENIKEKYSQRQITIAYFFLGEPIDKGNAAAILKEYSDTGSIDKFLTKRVSKASDLTKISENKTRDTKHLQDLEAAKRLITGKKNKKAENGINGVITTFKNNYQTHY